MAKINMRDYYPFYQDDEYVEVSDELAAEMAQWERTERSQKRKKYRYRANYSLDWGNGIGRHVIFRSAAPDEYYEKVITHEQLWLHSLKSNGNAFMLILFWGSLRHKLLALKV